MGFYLGIAQLSPCCGVAPTRGPPSLEPLEEEGKPHDRLAFVVPLLDSTAFAERGSGWSLEPCCQAVPN